MPIVLIVETGKHKGKRLKLPEGQSIVGRDEEAQIRINSNEVSRTHCLLIAEGARIVVRDLGSRNGTFINGTPIRDATELLPGDLLVIGPMGFRLPAQEPVAGDATPSLPGLKTAADKNKLSDDDIASWLADSMGEPTSDADTAVIDLEHPPAAPPSPAIIPAAKKKAFRTVAEEAADIIRRHKESLKPRE